MYGIRFLLHDNSAPCYNNYGVSEKNTCRKKPYSLLMEIQTGKTME